MSDYLEIARRFVAGGDPAPTLEREAGQPSTKAGVTEAPLSSKASRPEQPPSVKRCFFCGTALAEPRHVGPLGGAYLCQRCGGWNYPDTPPWVGELTSRALAANRRREIPRELSRRFSAAVQAGDEAEALKILAEIEAFAGVRYP